MSVTSHCEICGKREVSHTCNRCGQLVCEKHFEKSLGYCDECTTEVGQEPGQIPDSEDLPDDVDTYRF